MSTAARYYSKLIITDYFTETSKASYQFSWPTMSCLDVRSTAS